jgi:hypothetical protein
MTEEAQILIDALLNDYSKLEREGKEEEIVDRAVILPRY